VRADADQFVNIAPAEFGVARGLLELLVEKGVTARPVDLPAGVGKVEVDEFWKGVLDGVFPRRVEVVLCCVVGHVGLV